MSFTSGFQGTAELTGFIPEIWQDEIIAAYKKRLVMSNLVTRINHQGKKGDTIHFPAPSSTFRNSVASAKTTDNEVTLVNDVSTNVNISINKHFEYSVLLEDIASIQALSSMRGMYTDQAAYALARQVDFDLHVLGTGLQGGTLDTSPGTPAAQTLAYDAAVIGGDGSTTWDSTANTNTGNGSALTDAGIRKMIQTLDDSDIPMDERALIIPPVERKNLMGLARFTEQAFVGEQGMNNTIRTGKIGDIYGVPVYVSSNCPDVIATDTSTAYRAGMLLHKGAFAHVEQLGVRAQSQYMQQYLADLLTADTIYGVGELRNDAGVAFIVPS